MLTSCYDKLNQIIDKHIPFKKLSRKEIKFKSKPWITKGLKNSIKLKNKSYTNTSKQNFLGESQEWQSATALSQDQVLDLLSSVLRNSCFSFQEVIHVYQQVFGCDMGSPVSAVIAELVMQEVEQKALATYIVQPCWRRHYVDDANACLKKAAVQQFHDHLNAINLCIQFTVEMPDMSSQEPSIAFLDTSSSRSADRQVKVKVYRKATHTGKYLSFDSHSLAQSKRAVVRSLMDRTYNLPLIPELKQQEEQWVTLDLTTNGHPFSLSTITVSHPPKSRNLKRHQLQEPQVLLRSHTSKAPLKELK